MSPGQTGFVPGTKWVCPRDKPRFSSYFTQRKPSLSLGQTQFVPGTFRGRRAADRVYVLNVYVPLSFPRKSAPEEEKNADHDQDSLQKDLVHTWLWFINTLFLQIGVSMSSLFSGTDRISLR